ncbi:hypothetical protein ACFXTO_030269 [Malus domestica]
MLDVVTAFESKLHQSGDRFQSKISVPKQVLVDHYPEREEATNLLVGLEFPVIAKPLFANGSAKSHEMCLIFSPKGLRSLLADTDSPILLQQFVNHGGVVFKGYSIGEHDQCVKRRSLPDISKEQVTTLEGAVLPFHRYQILRMTSIIWLMILTKCLRWSLLRRWRRGCGPQTPLLFFFNFDVIRNSKDPSSYFVIDINYFPGYAKLPNYEHALTDFLLNLLATSSHPQSQNQKKLLQLKEEEAATSLESDVKQHRGHKEE